MNRLGGCVGQSSGCCGLRPNLRYQAPRKQAIGREPGLYSPAPVALAATVPRHRLRSYAADAMRMMNSATAPAAFWTSLMRTNRITL